MRDIESIVKEVADIYRESGKEAEEYLRKARRLKERFGLGLAIIYCWFYSVPQKSKYTYSDFGWLGAFWNCSFRLFYFNSLEENIQFSKNGKIPKR